MSRLILILLIVFAILFSIFWFVRGSVTTHLLKSTLGIPAGVEDVQFSTEGIILKGFYVENPEGSQIQDAFYAKSVRVQFNPFSFFFSAPVDFSEVEIEGARASLLFKSQDGRTNNWIDFLNSMASERKRFFDTDRSGPRFIIRKMRVNGMTVITSRPGEPRKAQPPMGPFELKDIGKRSPPNFKGIVRQALYAILQRISQLPGMENILRDYRKGVDEGFQRFAPTEPYIKQSDRLSPKVPRKNDQSGVPADQYRRDFAELEGDRDRQCDIPKGVYYWYGSWYSKICKFFSR